MSSWFKKRAEVSREAFPRPWFSQVLSVLLTQLSPSLCWHSHQVTELFLNQLMFLLPLAHEKCYAVLVLPLAFFLWKGSAESQEQGMAAQGQLRTQICFLTRLCPLVPTSADISRKKCRKITNFQRHLTPTKTSDVVLQIILSFILCHSLKYDNMKWNMKSENDKAQPYTASLTNEQTLFLLYSTGILDHSRFTGLPPYQLPALKTTESVMK